MSDVEIKLNRRGQTAGVITLCLNGAGAPTSGDKILYENTCFSVKSATYEVQYDSDQKQYYVKKLSIMADDETAGS